jgi:virulence-associated protein VapD
MFAIAFDLLWHVTRQTHPRGVTQAYADIGNVLNRHGFQRVQGSVYMSQNESLVSVTQAMARLTRATLVPHLRPRYPRVQGRTLERFYGFYEVVSGKAQRELW